MTPIRLHAWPSSPYSQKVKAFLDHHGLDHDTHQPNVITWRTRVQRRTGVRMIPMVEYGDAVLQDSADIIETIAEDRGLEITPPGPAQHLANALLHLLGDEWLIMSAMHYRWQSGAENKAFILDDFARCMLPGAPAFLRRPLGRRIGNTMQAHLRRMGLEGEIPSAVARWTQTVLDALDATLADQPYLFGGRAALADFALYGPIQAHLWRDPVPRPMVERRPHLLRWMRRLMEGAGPQGGWLADDAVPATLAPIFAAQIRDQFPVLEGVSERLTAWRADHPDATHPPAHLGAHAFHVDGAEGMRLARTFPLLRLQPAQDAVAGARQSPSLAASGLDLQAVPATRHDLSWREFAVAFDAS